MKKAIALITLMLCLIPFSGCGGMDRADPDAISFFYVRSEFQYHGNENVIVAEERVLSDSREDPLWLLTLYMMGPISDGLSCPFPNGVKVLDVHEETKMLDITISDTSASLNESRFTLACSCLAMTMFECTDNAYVRIYSGERSMSFDRESIFLADDVIPTDHMTEETR